MTNEEITQLYRHIGRELRELGAERIFLLSSKYKENSDAELLLEVAVTGFPDKESWEKKQKALWPLHKIETLYAEEEMDGNLDREMIEDSVQL